MALSCIHQEMTSDDVKLSEPAARTFLDRMLRSTGDFPLSKTAPQDDTAFAGHKKEMLHDARIRSVANVLGLAVVTSINYAQSRTL